MTCSAERSKSGGRRAGHIAALAAACAFTFAVTAALPFAFDANGLKPNAAYAGNGNGNNGNGNGNGREGAPGQQKQLAGEESAADEDAISTVAGADPEAGGTEQTLVVPIADDAEPAANKVVKELAGLPDESALSEEEELEAIRSGWGTWRTADGPETVIAQ